MLGAQRLAPPVATRSSARVSYRDADTGEPGGWPERGRSPPARQGAALGGIDGLKERSRDARPLGWARDLMQDLRYAHWSLRRAPGFTVVAIAALALGIGANTALFSVVSAAMLRPLPYPNADRLVRVWSSQPQIGLPRSGTALPDYRAWRAENGTFDELGAYHFVTYTATGTDRPAVLGATRVTASPWDVLKMPPLVYAGVTALFVAAACLACGVPALHAARVNPIETLRYD